MALKEKLMSIPPGMIIITILLSIVIIAFSSIGIEAYKQDSMKKFAEENKTNRQYLEAGAVIGSLSLAGSLLLGAYQMYVSVND